MKKETKELQEKNIEEKSGNKKDEKSSIWKSIWKKMERYEKSGKMKDDWKKVFETTGNKENE